MSDDFLGQYGHLFTEKKIPAKTTLLREGEIARQAYAIQQGCLRLWFNNSHIRDTPLQRYQKLLAENPHIVQRIPQHYIASYLGITPVSLSRIRNKI